MEAAVALFCIYLVSTLWWERRDRKSDPTGSEWKLEGRILNQKRKVYHLIYNTHILQKAESISKMDKVFLTWVADNWNFKWKGFFVLKLLGFLKYWRWKRSVGKDMEEKEVWRTAGNKNNCKVEMLYRRDDDCQVEQPVPWKKSSTENTHVLPVKHTGHRNVMCNKKQ